MGEEDRGESDNERTRAVRAPHNTTSGRACVKTHRLCLHGTCPQIGQGGCTRTQGLTIRRVRDAHGLAVGQPTGVPH